jgi:hypothetical protein
MALAFNQGELIRGSFDPPPLGLVGILTGCKVCRRGGSNLYTPGSRSPQEPSNLLLGG